MKVAIIMGSTSDLPKVEPAISILKNYGIEVNVRCLSAHRAHSVSYTHLTLPTILRV